jgi:hypothetical protein
VSHQGFKLPTEEYATGGIKKKRVEELLIISSLFGIPPVTV